jgi:BED zinc finger
MSSLSKLLAGRRKESPVWDYFDYNSETNKSKCKECAVLLSGKNPTNLTVHLSRTHKQLHEQQMDWLTVAAVHLLV